MIKVIRLTNGEHVVCDLSEGKDNNYLVKYPFSIQVDSVDQRQVRYVPFAPYSEIDSVIELAASNVMFVSDPSTFLIEQYNNIISGKMTPVTNE